MVKRSLIQNRMEKIWILKQNHNSDYYFRATSHFCNGAMVLLVGAILPYIIEEAGINYSVAGGFLSAFAIGNLLASLSIRRWLHE